MSLNEHHKSGTHCIALYAIKNHLAYCDRFCTEYVPLEVTRVIFNS